MENLLKEKWEKLKKDHAKIRIREAAAQLGVSEAELVATGVGFSNTLLKGDFQGLLKELNGLGYVMALTRNDYCVHERKGVYKKVVFNGHVGLLVTPDIDLRLFMNHWHFGFAVNENERLSFQFFDKTGEAVHKVYLTDKSNVEVYYQLKEKYKAETQVQYIETQLYPTPEPEIPDHKIDIAGFQKAWRDLQDTHDFYGMLKSFKLTRFQAMRLAPEGFTEQLSLSTFKRIMESVSESSIEIMVFTGSRGCIQIHTGQVKSFIQTGPWYNVLDPEFNMHLRKDGIHSIWLVKKPTKNGIVTSIEAYDRDGNIIVQFFGKRKPGIAESEKWRLVISGVETVE